MKSQRNYAAALAIAALLFRTCDNPREEYRADMKSSRQFTAIIQREGDGFVSHCPEIEVASQGNTVEEARANLAEAVQLLLETASPAEIAERLHGETYITRLEVGVG